MITIRKMKYIISPVLSLLLVLFTILTGCAAKTADSTVQRPSNIEQRAADTLAEQEKLERYQNALDLMSTGQYQEAMKELSVLDGYKDANALYADCEIMIQKGELQILYQEAIQIMNQENYAKAIELFGQLGDYENSEDLMLMCIEQHTAEGYDRTVNYIKQHDYNNALEWLRSNEDYHDAVVLRLYCDQVLKLQMAETAFYNGQYKEFLEYIEDLPDCDETAELYAKLVKETVFNADTAYKLHVENEASFDYQYPRGSIWTINSYSNGVGQDFWTSDYYLSLDGHEEVLFDVCCRCFDLPQDELTSISSPEHFVIVGEFSGYSGNFEFCNCRILSRTGNSGYEGVLLPSKTLYEVSGAKQVVDSYTGIPKLMFEFGTADNPDAAENSSILSLQFGDIKTISAGNYHTVALKADGTVMAVGLNDCGQCDVSKWSSIVSVSAGWSHTVGLKEDGTVIAVGDNEHGQCEVEGWTDIIAIAAGYMHTVGLKEDGTVLAVGINPIYDYGQCDVSNWTDIIAIAAGGDFTVGLKADGTTVAVGNNDYGQCDVSDWTDIVAVAAGGDHTVGIKATGTVVVKGDNFSGQCNVDDWTDIVAVAAGEGNTAGIKENGTVVVVGNDYYNQCKVMGWKNIVAISLGWSHTVGLKADGTMVTVGDNDYRQCDVSSWSGIRTP